MFRGRRTLGGGGMTSGHGQQLGQDERFLRGICFGRATFCLPGQSFGAVPLIRRVLGSRQPTRMCTGVKAAVAWPAAQKVDEAGDIAAV